MRYLLDDLSKLPPLTAEQEANNAACRKQEEEHDRWVAEQDAELEMIANIISPNAKTHYTRRSVYTSLCNLRNLRPDLLARVKTRELTVAAAMREAGWD